MSELLKISVIIPTYNRSITLLQAVHSVLQQTYPVSEILICDDGSTDDSKEKIRQLNNPLVKWIECGRNGAPAIPRNIGIARATGEWVAFLDSDDSWFPTKLHEQVKCILATSCLAVSTNATRLVATNKMKDYLVYTKNSISLVDLLWRNSVIISSLIVNRSLLEKTELFPSERKFNAIEDYALNLKIAALVSISFVNKPLVLYFDMPSFSIRSSGSLTFYDQRKLATDHLLVWIEKNRIFFPNLNRLLIFFLNSPFVKIKYFLVKLFRDAI
jgi:glycosyltransferase involved in cell wall biosynthesis